MITKLTFLAFITVIINTIEIRAEDMEFDMQKLKKADVEEMTTDLSEDEYADKSEVRLSDITYKPLQNSRTAVPDGNVEEISGQIMSEDTPLSIHLSEDEYADKSDVRLYDITNKPLQNSRTAEPDETVEEISGQKVSENTPLINAVFTNLSIPVAEDGAMYLYNNTDADEVMGDFRTGEKIIPKLQINDELVTDAVEENEIMTTELYNITSVWMEMNPINKKIEAGKLKVSGEKSSSVKAKSSNTANEPCEIETDNGPKEGLDISASLESNRTENSSEPFFVERKFKVDEANKDFNAEEILKRYEEIVNNDTESEFTFCKNGQCNDCNNMTIMNSTERTICFTFHNFREEFEDLKAMERMLQNTTKTSLDSDYEVMEKVCFNIQEEQFELVRQQRTTECVKKSTTKKKKQKLLKGRKFWPHHR